MRYVKATLLVAIGASMLIVQSAAAQQRVARLSDADQAIMDDFWTACAPQVDNARKAMTGKPDAPSDAEFRQFMNGMPTEMREGAKFQNVQADAAYYRETIAHARKVLAEPNQTDPTTPFMVPLYICLLETMIRHEPGGAAATRRTPVIATPSGPSTGKHDVSAGGEAPVDCVRLGDRPGTFKNVCDFPVYFTSCGINPTEDSWVARCDDPESKMGMDGIGANSVQGAFTGAERMYWFACRRPLIPSVKFIPGQGLYGTCR